MYIKPDRLPNLRHLHIKFIQPMNDLIDHIPWSSARHLHSCGRRWDGFIKEWKQLLPNIEITATGKEACNCRIVWSELDISA